jgi:hypothetical protein
MQELIVRFDETVFYEDALDTISNRLACAEAHYLTHAPWPSYPYKPDVRFSILHNDTCMFLQFRVHEKSIRATVNKINGPVWEDSCVEFFIAFDSQSYYNVEFNCIGTALVGFRRANENSSRLNEELIRRIRTKTILSQEEKHGFSWELTAAIPVYLFEHHPATRLHNMEFHGNFYKCGDALPEPHFLAWSNIEAPAPNFHLPNFFGKLIFE